MTHHSVPGRPCLCPTCVSPGLGHALAQSKADVDAAIARSAAQSQLDDDEALARVLAQSLVEHEEAVDAWQQAIQRAHQEPPPRRWPSPAQGLVDEEDLCDGD